MSYVVTKVGVIGGGTMGGGIAALAARQGLPVVVKEANQELAEKAQENIYGRFEKWYYRGKIDRHRLDQLESFVEVITDSHGLADAQLVIEAIPENLDWKLALFKELGTVLPADTIVASNTSTLPITMLGEVFGRPHKVLGMHFFNPPTTMALVELVRGAGTSDETMKDGEELCQSTLGKQTITVKDRPGFLVNCFLLPYLSEAVLALSQSRISVEAIDEEARKFGWPMGPFTLLDTVGVDTAYLAAKFLVQSYPDRMVMPPLFSLIIGANRLGEKTGGIGFYGSDETHPPLDVLLENHFPMRAGNVTAADVFKRMTAGLLNEAARAVEEGVSSKEDIELGAQLGLGCPRGGPLHIIDEMGVMNLCAQLEALSLEYAPRFAPCELIKKMAFSGETFFTAW